MLSDDSSPYNGLNFRSGEIRILDLLAGKWEDNLRCKLRVVSLDRKPSYEALSYTWGAPATGDHIIQLDRTHDVPITSNLFAALRRLRKRRLTRTLWIDALCINQTDLENVGLQVAIMGDVYRSASQVSIWLGEYASEQSFNSAFSIRSISQLWRSAKGQSDHRSLYDENSEILPALDKAIASTEPKWHDRAWVIQEFCMARKIVLCFGCTELPLDDPRAAKLMEILGSSTEPRPDLHAFLRGIDGMVRLRPRVNRGRSISDAIELTRGANCSKPIDKVFSLLSLINPDEAGLILKDPRQPVERVFASATVSCICTHSNIKVLELISFKQSRLVGLPSWAVEFSSHDSLTKGNSLWDGRTIGDNAAQPDPLGKTIVWTNQQTADTTVSIDAKFRHLTIHGVRLGHIETMMRMSTLSVAERMHGFCEPLAAFLQDMVRHRANKENSDAGPCFPNPLAAFVMHPDQLLLRGPNSKEHDVLSGFFEFWNLITGFSGSYDPTLVALLGDPSWPDTIQLSLLQDKASLAPDPLPYIAAFMKYARSVSGELVLFATVKSFVGLAPATLVEGDILVLIAGCKYAVILHKKDELHLFRGFAYVHGIWQRELARAWEGCNITEEEFILC